MLLNKSKIAFPGRQIIEASQKYSFLFILVHVYEEFVYWGKVSKKCHIIILTPVYYTIQIRYYKLGKAKIITLL